MDVLFYNIKNMLVILSFINQNMIILLASHKPLKEYFEETIEVHMNAGIIQKEKQEDDK